VAAVLVILLVQTHLAVLAVVEMELLMVAVMLVMELQT
jgi:hypothetical protein